MQGFKANIETLTNESSAFRHVLYTAKHSQLVVMSLLPQEDIGQEVHAVDQFFRIEKGQGKALVDSHDYLISDGDIIIVPAGAEHNIINTSDTLPLKLYTIYSPPNHKDGTIHSSKEQAEHSDEKFDGKITESAS